MAKTAKGPLSLSDKYVIKGMLGDGKGVEEIKTVLNREGKAVENYITKELPSLIDTIVEARLQRVDQGEAVKEVFPEVNEEDVAEEAEEKVSDRGNKVITSKELIAKKLQQEQSKKSIKIDPDIRKETILNLRANGLTKPEAEELLERAKKNMLRAPKDAEQLINFCYKQLNVKDYMGTKTDKSVSDPDYDPGVMVMTGAASAVADATRSDRVRGEKHVNRIVRKGNVWRPKDGKLA